MIAHTVPYRRPLATVACVPEPLERITLTGHHVQLEPLALEHVDGLVAASTIERDTYDYTDVPADKAAMTTYVERLLDDHAHGRVLPFAQRRLDTGALAGCTRYMDIRWWRGRDDPDEIEIGGTWLASSAQRTPINTEAKYLLLSNAFERYGVWRVAICTDEDNARSRVAIERIGATFEGILRNHRLRYNTPQPEPRNTAVYSIVRDEWPLIKQGLEQRLAPLA
jgi:RimJ/RimL family protein N-acetyltransferase